VLALRRVAARSRRRGVPPLGLREQQQLVFELVDRQPDDVVLRCLDERPIDERPIGGRE